ncbi:MAG: helix-hairpin-helix domain-containing protein, partial [Bacteroidota bacterium]
LVGREHYLLTPGADAAPGEILKAFLTQYYGEAPQVPPTIVLPAPVGDQEALAGWLGERHGRRIKLHVARRGEKHQLAAMAMENAAMLLEQERVRRTCEEGRANRALEGLARALELPGPPRRIEAFDISNFQGHEAVASMVVFREGKPAPEEYRRFRIRTVQGANDFAMLQEAAGRRFRRGLAERAEGKRTGFAEFPDLLLIDGGKGQLGAVLAELGAVGVAPAVIGLAKEEEEIFRPGDPAPLRLPRDSEALHLLQHLRDEAHRFAVTYHRAMRARGTRASALDRIAGVGPKRKQALLRAFGSVKRIMEASLDDLAAVEGMNRRAAEAVYQGLRKTEHD